MSNSWFGAFAGVAIAAALAGCGTDGVGFHSDAGGVHTDVLASNDGGDGGELGARDGAGGGDVPVIPTRDGADPSGDMTIVYAHSDTVLYAVDPNHADAFSMVGTFAFPAGDAHSHVMTDLAVDATGAVVGVSRDALWRIDATSAACTLITALPGMNEFVGLTYLPAGVLGAGETLVGGTTTGTYWQIDPVSGAATMLGQFHDAHGTWQLSGDIVSIAGAATYATLRNASSSTDVLATIDPHSGAVTVIGNTHYASIYGLGYWRATLYGFTRAGQFITIDVTHATSRLVSTPTHQFSGAGVTTVAPITPG